MSAEEFECLLEPRSRIELSTPVEGVVAAVHVDRGDSVLKGQLLVEIEADVERAAYEMARARAAGDAAIDRSRASLDFAERALARQDQLQQSGVGSARDMDEIVSSRDVAAARLREAEEERRLARLEVRRAKAALERRRIESPIQGVVLARFRRW